METEVIRALPIVPVLLLYWSALAVFFILRARRGARHEVARLAQRSGEQDDFEIRLSLPIGGFLAAALLPPAVLVVLALIR